MDSQSSAMFCSVLAYAAIPLQARSSLPASHWRQLYFASASSSLRQVLQSPFSPSALHVPDIQASEPPHFAKSPPSRPQLVSSTRMGSPTFPSPRLFAPWGSLKSRCCLSPSCRRRIPRPGEKNNIVSCPSSLYRH